MIFVGHSSTDQLEDNCFLAPQQITLEETVIIKAGGTVSPKPIGAQCKITVQTESKYDLQVSVRIITFRSCSVVLTLYSTSNVSLHYKYVVGVIAFLLHLQRKSP